GCGGVLRRGGGLQVPGAAVAEEVVREACLGVIRGIDRFEGRSSLKTWIFRILVNNAKTRGQREGRSTPFSPVAAPAGGDEPSVDPDRFQSADDPHPGGWAMAPTAWPTPEERLLSGETRDRILEAIKELPPQQR